MVFRSNPIHTDKFKELVHYICAKCEADALGATKLNKILWFCDAISFQRTGRPITEARYTKQRFGPVPKPIVPVIEQLISDGAIKFDTVSYFGKPKHEYTSLHAPREDIFSKEERQLIDEVIRVVSTHTASSISEVTHDSIWKIAEMDEEIPLYATLLSPLGAINQADRAWAKARIEEKRAV